MTAGPDPYDSPLSALRTNAGNLAVAVAIWEARQEGKPDAHARRAGSAAVDAVDAMLRELHTIRARLVGEIRASDDVTAIRADKLLAGMRGSNDSLCPSGPGDTGPERSERSGPSEKREADVPSQ